MTKAFRVRYKHCSFLFEFAIEIVDLLVSNSNCIEDARETDAAQLFVDELATRQECHHTRFGHRCIQNVFTVCCVRIIDEVAKLSDVHEC